MPSMCGLFIATTQILTRVIQEAHILYYFNYMQFF